MILVSPVNLVTVRRATVLSLEGLEAAIVQCLHFNSLGFNEGERYTFASRASLLGLELRSQVGFS
eukprot:4434068-Amphidinium_carterae.1